jgi:hypothetical protein
VGVQFSNFIHCHMRHLLSLPPREPPAAASYMHQSAGSVAASFGTVDTATEFLTSNHASSAHRSTFAVIPQVVRPLLGLGVRVRVGS